MSINEDPAISKIKQWLNEVIIGLNFCPFAKKEFVNNTIDYYLCSDKKLKKAVEAVVSRCHYVYQHADVETSLVIFPDAFHAFDRYLDLVAMAEDRLYEEGYEGVFQLASMHPDYCFGGEEHNDAANYTNRSPLPMVHIIREASLERVLTVYKKPEEIPENNIKLAREKGSTFFQSIIDNIHQQHKQ